MGSFALYFLAKLWLHATGRIALHVWPNLLLALFTSLPAPNARLRLAKNLVGWPLAIVLFYYDSFLPPPARALDAMRMMSGFSSDYLIELSGRLFSPSLLLGVLLVVGIYTLARRKLRLGSIAIAGLLAVGCVPAQWLSHLLPARSDAHTNRPALADLDRYEGYRRSADLDENVQQFHAEEATRHVIYTDRAKGAPFDVLILHVCSLSWDDLEGAGVDTDAFFSHFQIVLKHFNSAASYSGPAAIRLLRAHCGQSAQKRLYEYPDRQCLLFAGLEDAGYEPHWLMNHDGHFANFFADVYRRGGLAVEPDRNADADIAAEAFDGSPVYSDYDVLARWWQRRLTNGNERVALYYNTITLHDGNHVRSAPTATGAASYALRARRLFDDITRFLHLIETSGRRAIVVVVAEHGAAVRGDRYQIDGLREIPSPAITEVPVAIAYVGLEDAPPAPPARVSDSLSYYALGQLLQRSVSDNPFEQHRNPVDYAQGLAGSPFVAENDDMLVVRVAGRYLMRPPGGQWIPWDGRRQ